MGRTCLSLTDTAIFTMIVSNWLVSTQMARHQRSLRQLVKLLFSIYSLALSISPHHMFLFLKVSISDMKLGWGLIQSLCIWKNAIKSPIVVVILSIFLTGMWYSKSNIKSWSTIMSPKWYTLQPNRYMFTLSLAILILESVTLQVLVTVRGRHAILS